jgi:hypothetical protein
MSHTIRKDKKIIALSIAAATTTVIAGIMHIMMAPMSLSNDIGRGILFLVGGILQVFWAVPVVRQWGRVWQIIGIAGTVIFVVLWFGTHIHNLLGTGGHMPEGVPPGNVPQGNEQHEGFPQDNATGGHFPRGPPPSGIASIPQIEFFEIAFIGLYASLSAMLSKRQK